MLLQTVYGNGYFVVVEININKGSKPRFLHTNRIDLNVHPINDGEDKIENIDSRSKNIKYKDMFNVDLYKHIYTKIKSKPGNMTPGIDNLTLDGLSMNEIDKIVSQLKSREFKFKPSKRVYIKKSNGKLRPLGIPSPRDKIVQGAFMHLLEQCYEKEFLISSHGFRPKKSCHTALETIAK
jgi:retron-type reverse transcriptase